MSDYQYITKKFKKGEIFLNINATALIFTVIFKILEQVNSDLITLVSQQDILQPVAVRKFVVSVCNLDFTE